MQQKKRGFRENKPFLKVISGITRLMCIGRAECILVCEKSEDITSVSLARALFSTSLHFLTYIVFLGFYMFVRSSRL